MKLRVRGNEVTTTTLEFRMMEYLARHPGQVFTRDFLRVGNMRFGTHAALMHASGGFEKKSRDRTKPTILKTAKGVGYRLDAIAAGRAVYE